MNTNLMCCMLNILKEIGQGYHEKIYENGIAVDFEESQIECLQQSKLNVEYKGIELGYFIPDLITYGNILVDTKTIDRITDHERGGRC